MEEAMPSKRRSRYGPKNVATVSEVLDSKGHKVWTVAQDALVADALKMMAAKNVGALVVLDGDQIVGIFSERDYARNVILKRQTSKAPLVKDFMTKEVLIVGPDRTIDDCMALMTEKRVRHIPVVDRGTLTGIVSIGDVVNKVISDQSTTIKDLENYITGVDYGA
jgi:CBS domain-containing protein